MKRALASVLMLTTTFVCLLGANQPLAANELRVAAHYAGTLGTVSARHGILLTLFGGPNLSDPTNTIVAARYLEENGGTAVFMDLPDQPVYLVAIYDEAGSWPGTGPIPGPIGLQLNEAQTAPAAIDPTSATDVAIRFDDTIRPPRAPSYVERDLGALEAAEGVVEIRKYRIREGLRDEFAEFFEETLEAQKRHGLEVAGHFRSLDDENVFVWIRTFKSQEERIRTSRSFYLGSDWVGSRNAEAARLIESTEVILLEPTATSRLR